MNRPAPLALRRYRPADLDLLVTLENDAEVMRWISGGIPVDRAEILAERVPLFAAATPAPFGFWIVTQAAAALGWVSLRRRDGASAELGYRLLQSTWGQGIATEVCGRVVADGFAAGLKCIYAQTYEKNLASIRVMEKLGMTFAAEISGEDAIALSDTSTASDDVWPGVDVRYERVQP